MSDGKSNGSATLRVADDRVADYQHRWAGAVRASQQQRLRLGIAGLAAAGLLIATGIVAAAVIVNDEPAVAQPILRPVLVVQTYSARPDTDVESAPSAVHRPAAQRPTQPHGRVVQLPGPVPGPVPRTAAVPAGKHGRHKIKAPRRGSDSLV